MPTKRPSALLAMTCLLGGLFVGAGCDSFADLVNQSLIDSLGQGQPFADANTTDTADGVGTLNGMPALIYDVHIEGDADGGSLEREGTIYVLSTVDPNTSGNVVEVLIESGQPETSAELGAFLFATHTGLYQSTDTQTDDSVDLAWVDLSERDNTVTLSPDTRTLAITHSHNSFATGDGGVQELYLIDDGQIILEFAEDDTIGGAIEVRGTNTFNPSGASYEATLSGALRGTTSDVGGG
jgi:hypothetical protein